MPDDYAQRILAKLMRKAQEGDFYIWNDHLSHLVVDADVTLDEHEASWLVEFGNRYVWN